MIRKAKIIFVIASLLVVGGVFTKAYYFDSENVSGNTFSAGTWTVTPQESETSTVTTSPTKTVTATPQARVVVNEVYYNPDNSHGGGNAEWIELYNAGNAPVDLDGWTLWDNNESESVSGSTILQPGSFALISTNSTVWSYWGDTSGAIKIHVGGTKLFRYGLANDGDRVVLEDKNGGFVDSVNWGNDTEFGYTMNPSVDNVSQGHSIERDPDGYDTGVSDDFVDQANPTPGA